MNFKWLFVDEETILDRARWEVVAALRRDWQAQAAHLESLQMQGFQVSRHDGVLAQLTRTLLQHLPATRPTDLTTLAWCRQFAPQVLEAMANDLLASQSAADKNRTYLYEELTRRQTQIRQQEQAHTELKVTLADCRSQNTDQRLAHSAAVTDLTRQLTERDTRIHILEMQLAQAERDKQALRQQIQTLYDTVFRQQEVLNGRVA